MPPAVGNAAAISARANETIRESPPTMVQLEKAASGPPLASAKPSSIGIPETKSMVVNVAAQFSNMPSPRTKNLPIAQRRQMIFIFGHEFDLVCRALLHFGRRVGSCSHRRNLFIMVF